MKDYKDDNFDYNKKDNSHYTVPSYYAKCVREQYNMRPTTTKASSKGQGDMIKGNKQAGA